MTELDEVLRPMRALVITASDRASVGEYADRSGPTLVEGLLTFGFLADGPVLVADGDPVGSALAEGIRQGYDVILTTGGTGLTPGDRTPEVTAPLLDRQVPGLAEAIRAAGIAKGVAPAMLSRGLAGLAGNTLIINLPGSRGGCRDALEVLEPVLAHAVAQVRGLDHEQLQACTAVAVAEHRARRAEAGGEAG